MFDKIASRVLNPKLDRSFFRFVAAILLVIFLVSQLPWAEKLWGRILSFPDLRHHFSLSIAENENQSDLDSANLGVINLGYGTAREVLVHIRCRDGSILDYQIDSQELYQIKNFDLEDSVLDIWLDRLAPGGSIEIEIIGTGFTTDSIHLSATCDQGASIPIELPSFSSQADDYAARTVRLFSQAGEAFREATRVHEIEKWASTEPVPGQILRITSDPGFRTVALVALILIFLIVAFLPDGCVLYIVPFITGVIAWLFFDFQIPTWWAIAAAMIVLILWGIALFGSLFAQDPTIIADSGCLVYFGISLLVVLVIGGCAIWWYWHTRMSARWVLGAIGSFVTFTILMFAQQ